MSVGWFVGWVAAALLAFVGAPMGAGDVVAHEQPDGSYDPLLVEVDLGDGTYDVEIDPHASGGLVRVVATVPLAEVVIQASRVDGEGVFALALSPVSTDRTKWEGAIDTDAGIWDLRVRLETSGGESGANAVTVFLAPERPDPGWGWLAVAAGVPLIVAALAWVALGRLGSPVLVFED